MAFSFSISLFHTHTLSLPLLSFFLSISIPLLPPQLLEDSEDMLIPDDMQQFLDEQMQVLLLSFFIYILKFKL